MHNKDVSVFVDYLKSLMSLDATNIFLQANQEVRIVLLLLRKKQRGFYYRLWFIT